MPDFEDSLLDKGLLPFAELVSEENRLIYGPLALSTAAKEGKAHTLLADQFFSPSLLLAERIERGLLDFSASDCGSFSVLELGAGAALPSLLAATCENAPSVVTITDYSDDTIMKNLQENIVRNHHVVSSNCRIHCLPYIWGELPGPLLELLREYNGAAGYDVLLLSDLLYFDASHNELIQSITLLLSRRPKSRAFVAAGTYTHTTVCDNFFRLAALAGFEYQEQTHKGDSPKELDWCGSLPVVGLTRDELSARKGQVRWWSLWWSKGKLEM